MRCVAPVRQLLRACVLTPSSPPFALRLLQVTATHDHGILSVSIPKMEPTESPTMKMIAVKPAKKVIEDKK